MIIDVVVPFAANLDIDANENYEKLCTIELDTEEHMGKTVNKE